MRRLAPLLLLAACGSPAVLDVDRTEDRIGARLGQTYHVRIDAVSCPDEVVVEEGTTFRCTARVGDASVAVDVRQSDGDGTLEVEAAAAILSRPEIETDIAATLATEFARDDVEVTCPGPEVRVEEPEATFTCEAVDGDETKVVEVRVRDARGALAYTLR